MSELPPTGPMTLEHLRLYGSGWCSEATFAAMLDVIDASERRRLAEVAMIEDGIDDHEYTTRAITHRGAVAAENTALYALTAHLSGAARE